MEVPPKPEARYTKFALVLAGLLAGLIIAEGSLTALDLPRIHRPRSFPYQFLFLPHNDHGATVFTNYPYAAGITFVYDSNPRGYFSDDNSLTHQVNPWGFRDVPRELPRLKSVEHTPQGVVFHGIETKPPGVIRLLFLGDSLTFGEGVRDRDVYPQVTATTLNRRVADDHPHSGARFDVVNMGVSGYNTRQSLYALEHWGAQFSPDVVVLGYVLNDTEGPLWLTNPAGGGPRRDGARDVQMGIARTSAPPTGGLSRFRVVRAVMLLWHTRSRTRATIDYYRGLHAPSNPYLEANMAALDGIIAICRERGIPCVVVCFPVLYRLDDGYPFKDVHRRLRHRVESGGAYFVDLLDDLKGRNAMEMWVHPSDPHPNEKVHAAAAEALTRLFLSEAFPMPALQGQKTVRLNAGVDTGGLR